MLISSLSSGLLCALTTSPLDVVKSRVMGQAVGPNGKGTLYKGMLDCFVKVRDPLLAKPAVHLSRSYDYSRI